MRNRLRRARDLRWSDWQVRVMVSADDPDDPTPADASPDPAPDPAPDLDARRLARARNLASLTERVRELETQLRRMRARIALGTTPLRRRPRDPDQ